MKTLALLYEIRILHVGCLAAYYRVTASRTKYPQKIPVTTLFCRLTTCFLANNAQVARDGVVPRDRLIEVEFRAGAETVFDDPRYVGQEGPTGGGIS